MHKIFEVDDVDFDVKREEDDLDLDLDFDVNRESDDPDIFEDID